MKIIVGGILRQDYNYGSPEELQKELRRKCYRDVLFSPNDVEIIITKDN